VVSDYERICAPSMGAVLGVKVLLRADHSEQREVQLREGDRSWGGSTERIRELINKNRYEAVSIKASMHVNAKLLWSRIEWAVDLTVVRRKIAFLPGEISFEPERVTVINRSEKSQEAVVAACMERRAGTRRGKAGCYVSKRAWHQKLGNWGGLKREG